MQATGDAPVPARTSMEQPPSAPPDPPPAQAPLVEVSRLQQAVAQFARERDWERFHSPKNLAMALAAEAGEDADQAKEAEWEAQRADFAGL